MNKHRRRGSKQRGAARGHRGGMGAKQSTPGQGSPPTPKTRVMALLVVGRAGKVTSHRFSGGFVGAAFQQSLLAGAPGKRRPLGAPPGGRASGRVGGEEHSARSHCRGWKSTHSPGSGCGSGSHCDHCDWG